MDPRLRSTRLPTSPVVTPEPTNRPRLTAVVPVDKWYSGTMQHYGKDALYLEPGEIAVLAKLARRSVPAGAPAHPNALLLAALGEALAEMVDGAGVVIAPAPASAVRQAAQAYVRADDASASLPRANGGPKSVRLA